MINRELQKRILSSVVLIPIALFFIIKGSFESLQSVILIGHLPECLDL